VRMNRVLAAAAALLALAASTARAQSSPAAQSEIERVQAESGRAKLEQEVAQARAAEQSAAAARARGEVPARSAKEHLVDAANVVTEIVVLALLVLLWFALGRAPVQRWLAERHGAQVLLLWGAVILYTFTSCAASVASIFSRPGEPAPTAPILAAAWSALLIITWRWATARGAATRSR